MNKNEKKESKGFFTAIYTVAAIFLIMAFAFSVLKVSNHPQENANNDVVEDSAPVDKSNVAPTYNYRSYNPRRNYNRSNHKAYGCCSAQNSSYF